MPRGNGAGPGSSSVRSLPISLPAGALAGVRAAHALVTTTLIDDTTRSPRADEVVRHVLVLIGTRPEAIKMFPVVHALRRSPSFAPIVVTTGQHRDLVAPILELAGIEADHDLDVGRPGLTLNDLVTSVITGLDALCRGRFDATGAAVSTREAIREDGFPAATLVHGDTSSALAAALASFQLRIPVCHVEAGLRTWSTLTPFPEELNRQLISRIAALHLAPTTVNEESLVREGVRHEQIFVTGNTGIDALRFAASLEPRYDDPAVAAAVMSDGPLVVVTAHRRENWSGGSPASRPPSTGSPGSSPTRASSCRSTRTRSCGTSSASRWRSTGT